MTRTKKALGRAAAIGTALLALTVTTGTAQASWHPAQVGGHGANLRTCASSGCGYTGNLAAWTGVRIVCQTLGERVTRYYGTSALWDYVVWEGTGREGFAADANINTGYSYWIPGIETCR
ncbi:hypothetical protein [Actinosynnema pretiosum]|uniref:Secreted protein n=1 Tax=Actinosynnema pretiosum TaxID=42197 RepID=A0A290ZAI5_9PSEU|nr:hypothetical protein [Actinosynnema pretiosum]ATE55992.1 hypothetical protein CNX65_24200 [Actinosynnema pretiosum]